MNDLNIWFFFFSIFFLNTMSFKGVDCAGSPSVPNLKHLNTMESLLAGVSASAWYTACAWMQDWLIAFELSDCRQNTKPLCISVFQSMKYECWSWLRWAQFYMKSIHIKYLPCNICYIKLNIWIYFIILSCLILILNSHLCKRMESMLSDRHVPKENGNDFFHRHWWSGIPLLLETWTNGPWKSIPLPLLSSREAGWQS